MTYTERLQQNGGFTEAELDIIRVAISVYYSKTNDFQEEKICMDIMQILGD